MHYVNLATERERHLTTRKRAEMTKRNLRIPVCRSAIGQASTLICARRRHLKFPFCVIKDVNIVHRGVR